MDKELFKQMFSEYCKSEINAGHCEEHDCQWCAVNMAWDRIFCTEEEYNEEYMDDIADKLQEHILTLDNDKIEGFLGFSLDDTDKYDAVYQVITQMPDDVLIEYYNKYCKN